MRLDIITLFPELYPVPLKTSILGRAVENQAIDVRVVNLRDYTHDDYRTVDDRPYGGGSGMVMKAGPLFEAVEDLRTEETRVVLLTPQGETLRQARVRELAGGRHLILICGHYEGVDERVGQTLVDLELSIGDYVLTSGNLAALVLIDAVVRLLPGVLGCPESAETESFGADRLLDFPQYTRPEIFRGMPVPPVLLTGDHGRIEAWREQQRRLRTIARRTDLIVQPTGDEK